MAHSRVDTLIKSMASSKSKGEAGRVLIEQTAVEKQSSLRRGRLEREEWGKQST